MTTILAICLSIAMVASCGQNESSSSGTEQASGGVQAAEPAGGEKASGGGEQAAEPAGGGEKAAQPAEGGDQAASPASGGGNPCDAWDTCCKAYAKAIGAVQGFETAAKAQSDTCGLIEQMRSGDTGDQACTNAMSAMKRASGSVKRAPGFTWPSECD